jgi:hypothetical protein
MPGDTRRYVYGGLRNNNHRGHNLRSYFRKLLTIAGAAVAAGGLVLSAAAPALADTTDVYVQKSNLTVSTSAGSCSIFVTAAEGRDYASLFYNNAHSGVVCRVRLERSANKGKTWTGASALDVIGSRPNTVVLAKTYNYYVGGYEVRGCVTVNGGTHCTSAVTISGGHGVPAQEALSPSFLDEELTVSTSKGECLTGVVSGASPKSSTSTAGAVFLNQSSGTTCTGWLERTKNDGKTWYNESASHTIGNVSGTTTYAITATYADGAGYKVRACVRLASSSTVHCTTAW